MKIVEVQKQLCLKYNAGYLFSPADQIIGISLNIRDGELPINGLRHPAQGDTTGWYIWAGNYSEEVDFFQPVHVTHINDWCPWIEKYLGLAPGWRFLATPNYEDVWKDDTLLRI